MTPNTDFLNRSNAKRLYKHKSVDEWCEELDRTGDDGVGRFKLLSRRMNNSRAYSKLTRGGMIFVNAMLDKLEYERKGNKDRKNVKRGSGVLKNDGRFTVTNNELHARGIGSDSSIKAAREQAWMLGFFDVLLSATLMNCGDYQYSERWKHYPKGAYQPVNQPPPGRCLYPNRPSKSKPTTKTAVSSTTEIAVKDSADLPTHTTEIAVKDEQSLLQKSQLFNKLPSGVRPGYSGARTAKPSGGTPPTTNTDHSPSTRSPGGPPKHQGSKRTAPDEGSIPPLDPNVLKRGMPAKIAIVMASRGYSCTQAQERGPIEVQLGFSNGSAVHVRPTEYEYFPDGSNGKGGIVLKDTAELERLISDEQVERTR
jgi:hypothetical protein